MFRRGTPGLRRLPGWGRDGGNGSILLDEFMEHTQHLPGPGDIDELELFSLIRDLVDVLREYTECRGLTLNDVVELARKTETI